MVDYQGTMSFPSARVKRAQRPSIASLKKMATVVAIDPGGTTGWSVMQVHPDALAYPDVALLDSIEYWANGQIDCGAQKGDRGTVSADAAKGRATGAVGVSVSGEAAGVAELTELVRSFPEAAVVIEDFILRQFRQDRDLLSPVRVTAALSQQMWLDRRGFFTQQPSMAKGTITDERLKKWGMYNRAGGMQHARDADRHALMFIRRCTGMDKNSKANRMRAWPHLFGVDSKGNKRHWHPDLIAKELEEEAGMEKMA